MLKETLITIFSITLIIIGNSVTNTYANDSMGSLTNKLSELRNVIEVEEVNNDEANSKIDEVFGYWNEIYSKLAFFIEHNELEKVEQGLTEVRGNIQMEEYQEAVVKLDSTVFIIRHIEDKLAFELENIF